MKCRWDYLLAIYDLKLLLQIFSTGLLPAGRPMRTLRRSNATSNNNVRNIEEKHLQYRKPSFATSKKIKKIVSHLLMTRKKPTATYVSCCLGHSNFSLKTQHPDKTFATNTTTQHLDLLLQHLYEAYETF